MMRLTVFLTYLTTTLAVPNTVGDAADIALEQLQLVGLSQVWRKLHRVLPVAADFTNVSRPYMASANIQEPVVATQDST